MLNAPGDTCGCLLFVFLLFLLSIAATVFVLLADGPLILAEAAFQFLLAADLIRSAKQIDRPDWFGSVFARTWKPFGLVLLLTIILSLVAEGVCQNPTSLRALWESCGC